ncbi:MAG: SDR family oxidoreductase [Alphaproteobacteria bacterium]|nr:SDR family oxidoreductase [Alphaproteobacteria bacterium]
MDLGLNGKIALVTGAGQGVGRAIARTLAGEGAKIAINDLVGARAAQVAAEIVASGGSARAVPCDVTDLAAVRQMVTEIEREWGRIDILVNNAGVLPERRSGEIGIPAFVGSDPGHWHKFVDLNFFGVLNCVEAVGKGMLARRSGRIVTIVSDAGRVGEARLAVYSGAKAAAIGFTKALAKELGKSRINVNCVSLSAVAHEAPMADFLRLDATPENNETLGKVLRQYPIGEGLGRLTHPQDAADAVAFLASARAEYITGQTLSVNGGYAMP